MWNWDVVSDRMEYVDPFSPVMMLLAVLAIVTLLEATRRAVEIGLAWMIIISLAYMQWGYLIPGVLNSRPFTPDEILEASWLVPTAGGVYGPLTGIVATTIAVFIVFGSFMQGSGTGRLFSNLGAAAAGRFTGGPAKVAVITSGLFGTMSGSSVSNVITTGAMTIPLMIRIGYTPAVAGGIESAASVGGALMPPVMGAAAFVMAEITNIPYAQIVVAAAIGAVLYYFAILVAVHVEAKKAGMAPMAAADIPPWREVAQDAHLVIPIAILVWLMMDRWSGNYAAFCATIAMVVVAALRRRTRMGWRQVLESLANAGQTMAPLAVSIAGAGIVVSALTATGMVVALGGIIKDLAAGSLPAVAGAAGGDGAGAGDGAADHAQLHHRRGHRRAADPRPRQRGARRAAAGPGAAGASVHLLLRGAGGCLPARRRGGLRGGGDRPASPLMTSIHATRLGIAGFTVGFAFLYDPGIMLRGGLGAILGRRAIQVTALTALCAAYAGYLLRPIGPVLRVALGMAGAAAAFWHGVPDLLRLAIAAGALGALAALQLAARRPAPAAERRKQCCDIG